MKRAIGNANSAAKRYQDRARSLGCVACRLRKNQHQGGVTEIHHRTIGDMHGAPQLGHMDVVALCSWHHRGVTYPGYSGMDMRRLFGPSFASYKRDFMEWLQDTLGERSTRALQAYQDTLEPPRLSA